MRRGGRRGLQALRHGHHEVAGGRGFSQGGQHGTSHLTAQPGAQQQLLKLTCSQMSRLIMILLLNFFNILVKNLRIVHVLGFQHMLFPIIDAMILSSRLKIKKIWRASLKWQNRNAISRAREVSPWSLDNLLHFSAEQVAYLQGERVWPGGFFFFHI